jgi:hypothetical protein
MSETNPIPVRTFTTTSPIKACRLRRDDLARLYRIINERQVEYGQILLNQLAQQPEESPDQFEERRARVANAFITTVNLTGANNEIVSGSGEHFLASENIPDNILTVFYTTLAGPNSIGIARELLQSRATLLLDFSRPTILDFSKFPTLATENTSNFSIFSSSETWFTVLHTRLMQIFNERSTRFDWIHRPGMYDLLLLIIGLPFALSVDYELSGVIEKWKFPTVLGSALYVYFFIAGLFVFRGLFTYSRWVFPKVEFESEPSPPLRHRGVWAGIMIAILGAVFGGAIVEAFKAL